MPKRKMRTEKKHCHNVSVANSMLWTGLGLALVFWIVTSLLQFFSSPDLSLFTVLTGTGFEFYNRLIVVCMFIIFGSHARVSTLRRRRAEESVRESEEKYSTLLETIGEGYFELDLDGKFTSANRAMASVLCCAEESVCEHSLYDYLQSHDKERLTGAFAELKATGSVISSIEFDLHVSGEFTKIVDLSITLKTDTGNAPCGFRGICQDITEKRLLERNLIESMKDVAEARTGVILGLAKMAECRDKDTGQHLERIREFCRILLEELTGNPKYTDYVTQEYIDDIYLSSILHDIGKVGCRTRYCSNQGNSRLKNMTR